MFDTLLVANRGEIALRVIRAARELGIRTVAVYSEADTDAPHTRAADVAVRIGPAAARDSYLRFDRIVQAALDTGADAVHPGYGFGSERPEFAAAVTEAGLVFVGPTAAVMEQMGRKDAAREVAVRAGVPVVPSYALDADPATFSYPVLVKAAAGGGGKGMRVVHTADEFPAAAESARREAASSFGDDTLLVERFVERGRHVEVQVLADHHGHVVHLFERDCSAQRRHQKVIEEAPAPNLSDATRTLLHESAVALTSEVGYTNAGTVEFLVAGDEVFFLEMNTRLQVEHPVTEAITGLDLVQLQLSVAAGEPLTFSQADLTVSGHAFEARVYAEDAWHGFLPQAGTACLVRWPDSARVDAALESGQLVTTSYDPMLGKVIVHGPTREVARRRLVAALDDTAIIGLTTNTGFLRALAASAAYAAGEVHTTWLDQFELDPPDPAPAFAAAAWAVARAARVDDSPFGVADGWRLGVPAAPARVRLGEELVVAERPTRRVAATAVSDHAVDVAWRGQWFEFHRPAPGDSVGGAVGDGTVVSPMPGTMVRVDVAVGDRVAVGDVLAVVEAMKMELPLKSTVDGMVTHVGASVGAQVTQKQLLFTVEESAS